MKVSVKQIGLIMMAAGFAFTVASCRKGCTNPTALNYDSKAKKDDGSCIPVEEDPYTHKSGQLTSNETWTANNMYLLEGKVVVPTGITLTIEPGTIIYGQEGANTLASALVVAKGGTIIANGTASQPIIFTSILDNIQPGELVGTNLSEVDKGLWGGVVILGDAPISAADGDILAQAEGIPTSETYGAYGGSNATDNSGSFTYVSIRHGGATISANSEINGLTLAGVGSGTTIHHIEIIANDDDGIEFFGGTVSVSDIIVGFQGDDGIDIDQNYAGTVSNFLVVGGTDSDKGLEIDGPEGSTYTTGLFTLSNGTARVFGAGNAICDFKAKAQGTIDNVEMGTLKVRASYQNECVDPKTDAFTHLTDASPVLTFSNTTFSGVTVYTASTAETAGTDCPVQAADQANAESIVSSAAAAGGPTSWGWTWMNAKGKL